MAGALRLDRLLGFASHTFGSTTENLRFSIPVSPLPSKNNSPNFFMAGALRLELRARGFGVPKLW